jgi:hypothetical protein
MGLTAAIRKSPQTANGFTDQAIPEIEWRLMIPIVTSHFIIQTIVQGLQGVEYKWI